MICLLPLTAAIGAGGGNEAVAARPPPDWPIVVVEHVGGFALARAKFARLPAAYVTAKGIVITPSTRAGTVPTGILRKLEQRQLLPEAVKLLRELARAAGLSRTPPDYGRPPLADATTTSVTYLDDRGRTFVHRAYALGMDFAGPGSDARRRLRRFVEDLTHPETTFKRGGVGPALPFESGAFEVMARKVRRRSNDPIRIWPLASARLDQAANCLPVTGPDGVQLRHALRQANDRTRWRQDKVVYLVSHRPVLPGELPCR